MTPERWKQVEALYHEARARAPAERAAFLAAACPDDEALRLNVASLLGESASDDGFLDGPVLVAPPGAEISAAPGAMVGRSLAGYELLALLGAGGMGEVYRARDDRLGRDVAIKILPAAFTRHPERLARFEREARMLAALNHPNICTIHGFEDAAGVRLLILELVEGATLADAIALAARARPEGGAMPLPHVRRVARQIAEALEVAHDKGIVHRDLKPANIKITPDGAVKVLDFGLAKAVDGDRVSPNLSSAPDEAGPRPGAVVGTAAYMSPEQARGQPVDKRTDIWAFGCVLYEMLTGRVAFAGETISDSVAKILEREPDWSVLPADTPMAIRRLLLRCLTKDPKQRLRDIGDVRIELDALDDAPPGTTGPGEPLVSAPRHLAWTPWLALAVLVLALGVWEARRRVTAARAASAENPFAHATFSRVTNWRGSEEQAEVSPDGRFVSFLADRDGQLDVWVTQVGTGKFDNLTADLPGMLTPGNLLRTLGFSGDGSQIWFSPSGNPAQDKVLMPLTGGTARPFLAPGLSAPAWSPDNARLAYIAATTPGDPPSIADRTGGDPHPLVVRTHDGDAFVRRGMHTHNPVWSPEGEWIYLAHGPDPFGDMDVWRMRPSGESAEQLTHHHAPVNFLAPLDARTLLYVARADDWSGPWLWALDVESRVTRRVTVGLEHYTSVSASRDGRRVVATVASPTASLWRLPLAARLITDEEAVPYPVPTERALAPRFAGASLFYLSLSARGTGDGLWRVQEGPAFEVRQGTDGVVSEPPAPSPDGGRVAVVVRQDGRRHIVTMLANGTNSQTLAPSIDVQGVVGQGTLDWSPDGVWIVTGGKDAQGPGLFKIPVDGGAPVRLVSGEARGPVWSPKGDVIVYATPFAGAGGRDTLRGVTPDGAPVAMPDVGVRLGGAHRFLPGGAGLVYLPGIESKDFWVVDLGTNKVRQLTDLRDRGYLNTFDITPDGQSLVFDRSLQNADVVLIDLPRP